MSQAIVWILLVELMSIAALPLAYTVFRRLPDRGYALAKVLGLLLTAWAVWFVGMLGLPFNQFNSWALFILLFGGLNVWLLLRNHGQLRRELLEFLASKVWLIVVMELVFIAVFAYGANMHSYRPEIRGTEKPGDFAFLNSLVLTTKLPPADPWMSGYTINYYYFSHFMMALLTKMVGIAPSIAFDLSIPLVMGLVAVEGFGVVYNLVVVARQKAGLIVGAVALVGVLFIDFLGNLDALRQIIAPRLDKQETGLTNFVFNAWNPSRVIWDYLPIPNGSSITWTWTETINEFPLFSYVLADMHPHVMSLPFMLLAISGAMNLFGGTAGSNVFNLRRAEGLLTWFVLALSVGALIFINTWDYPTFLLLILLAAFVSERRIGSQPVMVSGRWLPRAAKLFLLGGPLPETGLEMGRTVRYLGFATRLIVASVVLYLPFLLTFTSLIGDNPIPAELNIPILSSIGHIIGIVAWNRTPLLGYFLVFGVFILPMLSFLAIKAWPYLKNPYAYISADFGPENDAAPVRFAVSLNLGLLVTGAGLGLVLLSELLYFMGVNVLFTIGLGLLGDPITAVGTALLLLYLLNQVRAARPVFELRIALAAICLLMIGCGYYEHCELYGPLIICIVAAAGILLTENAGLSHDLNRRELISSDSFVLLLMTLTGIINFAIEFIFLRDEFNSRFNTLFKFYYQSWLMYGLAAAYCVWRTVDWAWNLRARQLTESSAETQTINRPRTARLTFPTFNQIGSLQSELAGVGPSGYQTSFSVASAATEIVTPAYDPSLPDETELTGETSSGPTYADLEAEPFLSLTTNEQLEKAARQKRGVIRRSWWRWLWLLVMVALVMGGLVYTLLGPYEWDGHYTDRQSLDGEAWYKRDYPGDYDAVQWLLAQAKQNPNFRNTMLEAVGDDWVDYSLVSTFSGYPTVMGWVGHEIQWRGGKATTRDEVSQRTSDVTTIYSTTDVQLAQSLLKKYNVKYVYVGSVETSASTANSGKPKNYAPEALAKFAQFMHPIYNSNGVTIYSF